MNFNFPNFIGGMVDIFQRNYIKRALLVNYRITNFLVGSEYVLKILGFGLGQTL